SPAHSAAPPRRRRGYFSSQLATLRLPSAAEFEIIGADGSCCCLREKAQAARTITQRSARKALQHPHRKGLHRLGPPLHSLSWQTPSQRNGRAGNQRLPLASGSESKGRGFNAEPGVLRTA